MSRVCECGCGESLDGRHPSARFYSPACRAKGWKARTGYGRRDRPRKRRANGQRRPDLRISYRKAVEVVADAMCSASAYDGRFYTEVRDGFVPVAEKLLAPLLSERQREALKDRAA